VNTLVDVDRDFGLTGIGVLLALKRLYVARAVSGVIDNPGLLRLDPKRFGGPFDSLSASMDGRWIGINFIPIRRSAGLKSRATF